MTFKPGPLPSFGPASGSLRTNVNIDFPKAKKSVQGIAAAQILACKYAGIIRPKNQEPWNAEKLLLVSVWGTDSVLDLAPNKVPYKSRLTLDDCKAFEPGTVRYYICLLPGTEDKRRPLGDTSIACEHLANGKAFDLLDDALKEYEK